MSPDAVGAERIAGLTQFSVEAIEIPAIAADSLRVSANLDEQRQSLILEAQSLRSRQFEVLVQGADGLFREWFPTPPRTFRGYAESQPDSRVAASVRDGGLSARIEFEDGRLWQIEPLSRFDPAAAGSATHVVYRGADLIPAAWGCGASPVAEARAAFEAFAAGESGGAAAAPAVRRLCEVAFDADYEFFVANGRSVANVVDDIEEIMNGVTLLYESHFSVTFEITTIVVRTAEPDPYSSNQNQTLLTQFHTEWNTNMGHIHRDIAHLMTGKDILGGVVGTAYTGALCEACGDSARGYGFSESHFTAFMPTRVCLTAHEIGHNFGASHCDGDPDCYIMCATLNACGGSCTQFGPRSRSSIEAKIALVSCLSSLSPPINPPFCDTFGPAVDLAKWSYNAAAVTTTTSRNPPSPPYALLLDTCCAGCPNAPDDVRTNVMRLAMVRDALASYHTQHVGGASTAGAQLVVEYVDANGDWQELNRVVSNGISQTQFTRWTHELPPDALHDEFRLRFRLDGLTNQPLWYVDDVSVADMDANAPILYVRADASAGGSGTSWPDAFDDLQGALAVAACSRGAVDEIWVARGVYRPDQGGSDRGAAFRLVSGVTLLGGFAGTETDQSQRNPVLNPTILSGDIGISANNADNSLHVIIADGVASDTFLDGFVVTGGNANGTAPDDGGGGLRNASGRPTVRRCTFTNNSARIGGAVQVSAGGELTISECTFQNNTAGSAGGALHSGGGSTVSTWRSALLKNTAGAAGGGIFASGSTVGFSNCAFSGNSALSGGAMQNFGGVAELFHCTLAGNSAAGSGGGILNIGSSNILQNCILWGNSDLGGTDESAQIDGQAPDFIAYTCLQGFSGSFVGADAIPGTEDDEGNSSADPQFVSALGADGIAGTSDDDLHLAPGSPAINAGDPDFIVFPGALDMDGHARVLCGRVDPGAYEFGIGDSDCDQAVSLNDFSDWPACWTGPAPVNPLPDCDPFDFDGDADVDLQDFAGFSSHFAPN